MKELATRVMKKVTLEIIYEAIEERSGELKGEFKELKEDVRYLNQKVDSQIGQLNQRFDTVMQMLVDISKK